jgi:hypothetical protein
MAIGAANGDAHRGARMLRQLQLLAALAASIACGSCSKEVPPEEVNPAKLYSSKITSVDIEVHYGKGAEPYTGTFAGVDLWTLFRTNATRLVNAGNKFKTLTVPTTLPSMQELSDVTGTTFTVQQILDIARAHRRVANDSSIASFYVLFLPGYYQADGEKKTAVLGISIAGTGVVAIFKPVIENAAGPTGVLIEQSTLIHEFGHAIGLVNEGVPLVSAHQDSAHGAHCANTSCVMYYQNEGAFFARSFISGITSDTAILFDSDCLADLDAFASAQD